jgi:hypothetical protein
MNFNFSKVRYCNMPRRPHRKPAGTPPLPLIHADTTPSSEVVSKKRSKRDQQNGGFSYNKLLSVNEAVSKGYMEEDSWSSSPFSWIRTLPTASRAKAAESIVARLLQSEGFLVQPRFSKGHDLQVEGRKLKVRFSTLWSTGAYAFQKVAPGDYEILILFGLSPENCHVWALPASLAAKIGASAGSWFSVDPTAPPEEILPYGGTLGSLYEVLSTLVGPPSSSAIPL